MIELFIDGQAVDIAPDTKITLNFNSNIFGDISKIQPSNSFTIALPKTPKNGAILGSPASFGGSSKAPYKKWDAELFVNGVSVVNTAYAVLLSVGDDYEIALYWGVVKALAELKDGGKTLQDFSKVLKSMYGARPPQNWWVLSWWAGFSTSGISNVTYNSGIPNLPNNEVAREQVALLPSVYVDWIWAQIVADNNLTIHLPEDVQNVLNDYVVPFTTRRISDVESSYDTAFNRASIKRHIRSTDYFVTVESDTEYGATFCDVQNTEIPTSALYTISDTDIKIPMASGYKVNFRALVYESNANHDCEVSLQVDYETRDSDAKVMLKIRSNGSWEKRSVQGKPANGSVKLSLQEGDVVVPFIESKEPITINSASISYQSGEGERDAEFGDFINTRDNLPSIKQIDFIKAIMAMFGLFATLKDGEIYLVPVDDLYSNKPLDWSHKLVGTGDGDANKTSYKLSDYVQRNILKYKDDNTVEVDASGVLVVEDEALDKEKELITIPFAASYGDLIPMYKWKDDEPDTEEVEEVKVEPRIMRVNKQTATMSFEGLAFSDIIQGRYAMWQKVMRQPIVIEEKMNLSEVDVKNLDYRQPIYLQKYGASFAVQKVQWSEGYASTVTLVYLPPKDNIAVALPYAVTTGVTFGAGMGSRAEIKPEWDYLVSGAGDYYASNAVLSFDNEKAKQIGIAFRAWTTEGGNVLSTKNPYEYDGSNGDMLIYANTSDIIG